MKENTVTRAITLLQWKLKFYTTQVTKVIQVILWPSDNMNAHFPIGMLSSCTKPDWLLSALMSNPESRRHTSWTSSAAVLRLWEITDPLPHSQALQGPPSAFFIKVPAQCHKRASLFFFFLSSMNVFEDLWGSADHSLRTATLAYIILNSTSPISSGINHFVQFKQYAIRTKTLLRY